ncbi:hypothetical protein ACQYAD_11775 [Neobacillus sp. SM06]|uniref:hypothetical protein n=1 Tax=Neobacillus sp. SM06 TaxID=3422492 RepID=UPI003D2CE592
MKRRLAMVLSLAFMIVFGWGGFASAHVSNEKQIYKDVADSQAKEEITKLRAIGVIGFVEGEENFEPKSELNKKTLGFWLAKAGNLKGHTEKPTPDEYAEESVENKYIDNLEGKATYGDVVTGILKVIGVKDVEKPAEQAEELGILEGKWHDLVDANGIATKENTALLFDMALDKKGPSGKSINDILGIKPGPVGIVNDVKEEKVTVDGQEKETFKLTIDGKEFPFYGEGKIALYDNLLAAKGKQAAESYLKTIVEPGKPATDMIVFVMGEGNQKAEPVVSNESKKEEVKTAATNENSKEKTETAGKKAEKEAGVSVGTVWTVIILVLAAISIGIYVSGRKKA